MLFYLYLKTLSFKIFLLFKTYFNRCYIKLFEIIHEFMRRLILVIIAVRLNYKLYIKLGVKVLCFVVLFVMGIQVTKEYFSYPYVYRLSVKPSERLDLLPITICTERDVLFDKTRINQYFNITHDMINIYAKRIINKPYNECIEILLKEIVPNLNLDVIKRNYMYNTYIKRIN